MIIRNLLPEWKMKSANRIRTRIPTSRDNSLYNSTVPDIKFSIIARLFQLLTVISAFRADERDAYCRMNTSFQGR